VATNGALVRRALVTTLGVASLSILACPRRRDAQTLDAAPSASASTSTQASAKGSASTASAAASQAFATVPLRALVAAEAWEPAAHAIEQLSEAEQSTATVRLARLRISIGRCTVPEGERALEVLAKLREMPESAPIEKTLLARLEVDALVCANKLEQALTIGPPHGLASREGGAAFRTLARALEAKGDVAGARTALSKAITDAPRAGLDVDALVAWRLRLDRKLTDAPAIESDRRKLFLDHPRGFELAVAAGEPADPPKLSLAEWLERANTLASLGRADDALKAIDEAAKAGALPRQVARLRGSMLYKAKAYDRAATALMDAAKLGIYGATKGDASAKWGIADGDALYDGFHAARALSRSGDDLDAIPLYDAIAKARPKTHWGIEAMFLTGNLRFLNGHYKEAIEVFDNYLSLAEKLEKQEQNKREARRGRAMAMLLLGHVRAAKALHELSEAEEYEPDSFAVGRIELMQAAALQKADDAGGAISLLTELRKRHPYGYLDVAARRRLVELGQKLPGFPVGPIVAPTPPVLPAPADLFFGAGLSREALAVLPPVPKGKAKDDGEQRCATLGQLDAGAEQYVIGVKLDVSVPPASGWTWRCAYPTPYAEVVDALETRESLPHGLVHAVLRQESAFRLDVVSNAGAVGVAQLMPSTAATTAKDAGIPLDPNDTAALQAPFLQLDLCARHLHTLYVDLGVDPAKADPQAMARTTPLVIAAYNAGVIAVKRWLSDAGTLDSDLFLERIPFLETRGYTARVYGNLVRYAIITGNEPPVLPAKLLK
jgi:soluble lytic murein transglycosylase